MKERPPRPTGYSEPEARGILERALAQDEPDFSSDDLLAMAEKLEVGEAELRRAEQAYYEDMRIRRRKEFVAERRKKALRAGSLYLALCCLLYLTLSFGIVATIHGLFVMPLVFLGMYLVAQLIDAVFRTSGNEFEQEFNHWRSARENPVTRR